MQHAFLLRGSVDKQSAGKGIFGYVFVCLCVDFWIIISMVDLVVFAIVDHLQIDKEIERSILSSN